MSRSTSPAETVDEFGPVPSDLAERDRWVCWTERERDGKLTKIPVDPHTGDFASATDPETWGTLADARDCHAGGSVDIAGIGFVFAPEDTICGIDLDDARDPETGEPEPWARDIIQTLDSFTEVSPSGTGYHVYIHGFVPEGGNRRGDVELYDRDRFFTFTGDHVDPTPTTVNQRNDSLAEVHAEYVADDDTDDASGDATPPSGDVDLSDQELLDKARDAENGDRFARLWRGDTSGYPSHSEADQALCNLLAFWTGGDRRRVDRLFRESGLMRDKWDEDRGADTYGEITIQSALDATSEYYDPEATTSPPESIGPTDEQGTPVEPERGAVVRPDNFAAEAGLGEDGSISDLNDKQKAAIVWRLIKRSDEYHIRVHRETGALWAYDDGVWSREGERALQFAARKAVNPENYGANLLKELKAQVRADPYAEIGGDTLGLEAGYVAVENGLLDLRAAGRGDDATRELMPDDYALQRLPVEYDPDADGSEWSGFVADVVESEKRDTLQEYVGYTLHRGEMPFNRAVLLVGSGANGKSTFLNAVRAMLGQENTETKPIHKFDDQNAVADLEGSIANIDADLSEGSLSRRGLAMFKRLVGGDMVDACRKYKDPFSFNPVAKHLYACNQVPDVNKYVTDDDTAFWRRWLIIQFPEYIPPNERDPLLEDRLTEPESLSAVLNWAIEGWTRLMDQGGFTNAETPSETRRLWQSWGDSADEFLANCIEHDPDAPNITTSEAWAVYNEWCRQEGKDPAGQQSFTGAAKSADVDLGYAKSVRPRGTGTPARGYKSFGLTNDAPELEAALESNDDGDDDDPDTDATGLGDFEEPTGSSGDTGGGSGDAGGSSDSADDGDSDSIGYPSLLADIQAQYADGDELTVSDVAETVDKSERYVKLGLAWVCDDFDGDVLTRESEGVYRFHA
jgi:P4 family phage/plasmid primase-like protien